MKTTNQPRPKTAAKTTTASKSLEAATPATDGLLTIAVEQPSLADHPTVSNEIQTDPHPPGDLTDGELTVPPVQPIAGDHPAVVGESHTVPHLSDQPGLLTEAILTEVPEKPFLSDHPKVTDEIYPPDELIDPVPPVAEDAPSLADHPASLKEIQVDPPQPDQPGEPSDPQPLAKLKDHSGRYMSGHPGTIHPEQFELPAIAEHLNESAKIYAFAHHTMSPLSAQGQPGKSGVKSPLAAVKEVDKSVKRLDGSLALLELAEMIAVPPDPDFFNPSPDLTNPRRQAWKMIRTWTHLRLVILTYYPERIHNALPADWGGGDPNVCLGLVAKGDGSFSESLQALQNVPAHHRMLLVTPASGPIDLNGKLAGIDWVVCAGREPDAPEIVAVESACREAGIAFHFHNLVPSNSSESAIGLSGGEESLPAHPFGPKLQLGRPSILNRDSTKLAVHATQVPSEQVADSDAESGAASAQSQIKQPVSAMESTAPEELEAEPVDEHVAKPIADSPVSGPPPTEHFAESHPVGDPETDTGLSVPHAGTPTSSGRRRAAKGRSAPNSPVANSSAQEIERQDYLRLDAEVRRDLRTFKSVGKALEEIRDRELWRAGGHVSWAAYCLTVGGLTKVHANRQIKAAKIDDTITKVKPTGSTLIEILPSTEWQIRPLYALEEDPTKLTSAWALAVKGANGGQPTAKQVSDAVAKLMESPPVSNKPKRKELIAAAYRQLDAAVTSGLALEEIGNRLKELGELLKLA